MDRVTHIADGTDIVVTVDGLYDISYKFNFTAGLGVPIALQIDDTAVPGSTVTATADAGEMGGRVILSLSAGQVIKLTNISRQTLTVCAAPAVAAQVNILRVGG